MTGLALPLGLAWLTFAWVMGIWPVTATIALTAMIVDRNIDSPPPIRGLRRSTLCSPIAVTAVTLLWASVFYSPAYEPPPQLPWFAYVIGGFYALQLALAGHIIRKATEGRGRTFAVVLLPQLWVGLVASLVSLWAVTSGGTLGAL